MSVLISPSILAANFGNLSNDISLLNKSEADWIHVDVMDGVFVPNISFGFPVMEFLQKSTQKPLDVHLMIVKPEKYIEKFVQLGAQIITVHYEACKHLDRIIHQIKDLGCKAGVAINPHTSVQLLENVIQELDLVLIMSVNPGFGGQSFIQNTIEKVKSTQALIHQKQSKAIIEIDGGVNLDNAKDLIQAGAQVLVAGSAIFHTDQPLETIQLFKKIS